MSAQILCPLLVIGKLLLNNLISAKLVENILRELILVIIAGAVVIRSEEGSSSNQRGLIKYISGINFTEIT